MINKKLGISVPWLNRTTSNQIVTHEIIKLIIINIFLKQNIFISEIYIQQYNKVNYIILNLFPIYTKQFKLINKLIVIVQTLLTLVLKKNTFIKFNITLNLYNNVDILSQWVTLKLYNQPSNIKKLLKQIIKQYDTITK